MENMEKKKIENMEEKKIENVEVKNGANVVKDEEEVEEEVTNLDDDLSPGQGMALEEHYDELPHPGPCESRAGTLNGGSTDIKRYQKPALPPKPTILQRRNTKSGERQSGESFEGSSFLLSAAHCWSSFHIFVFKRVCVACFKI